MARQSYCPVDEPSRAWLDYRWSWLCQRFGTRGIKQRVIVLPSPKYFPDAYEGKPEHVEILVHRVARYMDIAPDSLEVRYYEESPSHTQGTLGMYVQNDQGKFEIWLEVSQLHDPERMIATIAHELGHVLLLGQGRITADIEDHEPLTDLLTVFYGLGVFPANTALHENYWHEGHYAGWTIGRQGYLTMNHFGYAFALLARSQSDSKPEWLKHLRLDVRKACLQSLVLLPSHADLIQAVNPSVAFPSRQSSKVTSLSDSETDSTEELVDDAVICTYCNSVIGPMPDVPGNGQLRECLGVCEACNESMEQADQDISVNPVAERWQESFNRIMIRLCLFLFAFVLLRLVWEMVF